MTVTYDDVVAAADRIAGGVSCTPCPASVPLSLHTGSKIYCKLDYLQRTGSFKERGARNALLLLDGEARSRGVIAASAGNHAQALAYHGQLLGIPVTVFMPRFAPLTKVVSCQKLGATVMQKGEDYGEALALARQYGEEQGMTYVHGFDDPAVIAGQGTLGLEILEQVPGLDAVVVPVGGGGLLAGIALAIKTARPEVEIIAVEPKRAASLSAAMQAGTPVDVPVKPTLADGLAVGRIGANVLAVLQGRVDRVVTVDEPAIALAVLRLLELEKSVVEGAGAACLAAMLDGLLPELEGRSVVLPLCGGNIDSPVLGQIIERGLAADGRLCRFTATISDRPGGLAKLATVISQAGASIRDIAHMRAFTGPDLSEVRVQAVVETRDADHIATLHAAIREAGMALKAD